MIPIELPLVKENLKKRDSQSHKGTHGHALLIAGSNYKMGAAIIASKACLRSGVGLLSVSCFESEKDVLFNSIPEAMFSNTTFSNSSSKFTAVGIGPGIGVNEISLQSIYDLFENDLPTVFDADALNLIAKYKIDWSNFKFPYIITPHFREFDRLFGEHESLEARIETAKQKANELNCIIVLKNHQTHVIDGSNVYINTTGNAGLAKAGSGDALMGMITSFLAQGYSTLQASVLGVFLHGLAADITLKAQSEESMLITDVIENFGKAFQQL